MKFNKIKLIVALCLALGVSALGQNNVGTLVTDPVRPFSVSSTHPSAIANEIKGGPFTSSNLAGLSNIPAPRLEIGAIGYATNTGLYYRLTATNPATWSPIDGGNITNLNASNITGSIPFLNISNALTNASVAFGNASFNNQVSFSSGTVSIPSVRFGSTNFNFGLFQGNLVGFGNWLGVVADGLNIARFQSNRVYFDQPIAFASSTSSAALTTRTNLGIQDFVTNPVVQVVSGGTGATNAGGARTNLGLGATNNVTFTELTVNTINNPDDGSLVLDLVNGSIYAGSNGVLSWDTNIVIFSTPINFNNSTNIATTRTNLGLGATWLTNTNVTNFRTAIGLGQTNNVQIGSDGGSLTTDDFNVANINISGAIAFTNAATTRTNLGLGWPALTNSNVGTGLVSVNTNGVVVSPTNFWQVAPIQTIVQNLAPITNSTNAATNARNLYVYSLATNITGVTNTVTLPTNTSTFGGDNATIIHQGPTSSVTVVRQAGDTNDLISINRFDESVKFIYENNAWAPYHNISFQEPIYFSGTNVSNNAAITRTNLGLGQASSVRFGEGTEANVGVGVGSTNIGLASGGATIQGRLGLIEGGNIVAVLDGDASPFFGLYRPITFQGTNATSNAATTRTNLFGHGGLSTNIDIKLNNNDGMRLYFTNGILTNAVTPIP